VTTLAKYNAAEARDGGGRWTGSRSSSLTVPSVRRTLASTATRMLADTPPAAEPARAPIEVRLERLKARRTDPDGGKEVERRTQSERRSLTRGEAWQRIGAKLPELPIGYTGSKDREAPVDGFKELKVAVQAPKALPLAEHIKLLGKLKQVIQQNREDAIEKAKATRQLVAVHGIKDRYTLKRRTGDLTLDPQTPKGAVHRAYNHAAMLALHDFGAVDYGPFKMSDAQKEELTPLVPFMRYTRRRLFNAMRVGDLKGKSGPYRAEFGKPFADSRKDKVTGAVRLRLRPNDQFVKIAPAEISAAAARASLNPTPAQVAAGNYPKGHVRIGGLDVAIETRRGGMRRGIGPDGTAWQVKMPAHYGYVKRSQGFDGDAVDVYLGPSAHKADTLPVHVVDQVDAASKSFDEHKAMLGFKSKEHAIKAYDAAFSDGRGSDRRKAITSMPFDKFKRWVAGSGPMEPLAKRDMSACLDTRVSSALMEAHGTLRRAGKKHGKGITDSHVAVAMGDVSRILGAPRREAPHSIASRNEAVRDTRIPLAQILGAAA
jgi:hypothetical protein